MTKCIMPRQALDSVLNRIAEVQVGSFKSANGSWRKMAATWGRRCADSYQLICRQERSRGRDNNWQMRGRTTREQSIRRRGKILEGERMEGDSR